LTIICIINYTYYTLIWNYYKKLIFYSTLSQWFLILICNYYKKLIFYSTLSQWILICFIFEVNLYLRCITYRKQYSLRENARYLYLLKLKSGWLFFLWKCEQWTKMVWICCCFLFGGKWTVHEGLGNSEEQGI